MAIKKFRYSSSNVVGDAFYESSATTRGTLVSLIGFPSFPGPNSLVELGARAGYFVLQPHYPGTYDSPGEFGPNAFIETIDSVRTALKQGIKKLVDDQYTKLPDGPLVICGHSFGCAALLRGVENIDVAFDAVFFAPAVHYGRGNPDYGLLENAPEHFAGVRKTNPYTYRLASDSAWHDIVYAREILPEHAITRFARTARIIIGSGDKYFDRPSALKNLPDLIRAYYGAECQIEAEIVEGAAHPIGEILSGDYGETFSNWLKLRLD